jgi:hypothetical protein
MAASCSCLLDFSTLLLFSPSSSTWLQLWFVLQLLRLHPGLLWLEGLTSGVARLGCSRSWFRKLDFNFYCNTLLDPGAGAWNMGWELLNSKGGAKRCQMGAHGVEGKGVRDRGTMVCNFLDFWASEAEIKLKWMARTGVS